MESQVPHQAQGGLHLALQDPGGRHQLGVHTDPLSLQDCQHGGEVVQLPQRQLARVFTGVTGEENQQEVQQDFS